MQLCKSFLPPRWSVLEASQHRFSLKTMPLPAPESLDPNQLPPVGSSSTPMRLPYLPATCCGWHVWLSNWVLLATCWGRHGLCSTKQWATARLQLCQPGLITCAEHALQLCMLSVLTPCAKKPASGGPEPYRGEGPLPLVFTWTFGP